MKKLLLTLSFILLLASAVGAFIAFSLPEKIEASTTVLNYEHEGRFDYLVYLKPSHLFGNPPEELPPNPIYPAEIVDTIDFTFSYSPAELTSETAWIDAVLENPGIWEKKVQLVPSTSVNGDFTLRGSLNISEIQELFDNIEEDLKIKDSPRYLTIRACVTAPGERFIHDLPIKLTDTVIEVDSNLKHSQACGASKFNYVVNLAENYIFDTKTLESPEVPAVPSRLTVGPEQMIFPKLIDEMDVTFYYSFRSGEPVTNITTDVEITTYLYATRGEDVHLWTKEFPILYTREDGDFSVNFPLNIVNYLELLEAIRAEAGISGEFNNLTIIANVHTVAETRYGLIDENFSQTLSSALGKGTLEWNEELVKSQPGSIKKTVIIANPEKYLGLPVSQVRILSAVVAGIIFAFFMFSLVMYFWQGPEKLTEVDRQAQQAKKKYKDMIVDIKELPRVKSGETVVSLESLDDLVKAAEGLLKPVLHKGEAQRHIYFVLDASTRYEYVLSEQEHSAEKEMRTKTS